MLLSTAYLPPVEYFAAIAANYSFESIYIEACEHYQKQSYRNRFKFLAPDGPQALNFPVVHEGGTFSLPIQEIKVDWSTPWAAKTKRALDTAYYSSAFYEYYRDELFSIYDSRPVTLWGLNTALTQWLLRKFGIPAELVPTHSFCPPDSDEYGEDLRGVIHPKRDNSILSELGLEKPYYQVFGDKFGFVGGLSAIDLLFNEGPGAIDYLI